MAHTSIEKVERIIQSVRFIHFGITTEDDKGVSYQQARVAHTGPWPFRDGCYWKTRKISTTAFQHPKIPFDSRSIYQSTHHVYVTFL
jgi:hypothetical protein